MFRISEANRTTVDSRRYLFFIWSFVNSVGYRDETFGITPVFCFADTERDLGCFNHRKQIELLIDYRRYLIFHLELCNSVGYRDESFGISPCFVLQKLNESLDVSIIEIASTTRRISVYQYRVRLDSRSISQHCYDMYEYTLPALRKFLRFEPS